MNIWKAAAIGGAVFVAVKLYKDGKLPLGLGIPAPAGTLPAPESADTATPGGGGIVNGDPTVLPGDAAPEQAPGCNPLNAKGCNGGGSKPPIVRDHRTPGRVGTTTKPKPGGVIACVRAPCPVKPESGGVNPHAHSAAIQRMGGRTPLVW